MSRCWFLVWLKVLKSPENTNEDQKRLARMRQKYVEKNPMTMDEINSVIEGE